MGKRYFNDRVLLFIRFLQKNNDEVRIQKTKEQNSVFHKLKFIVIKNLWSFKNLCRGAFPVFSP